MEEKKCNTCNKIKLITEFNIKSKKGDKKVRLDKHCKQCKNKHLKDIYHKKKLLIEFNGESRLLSDFISERKDNRNDENIDIYKEYKYPNGQILRLTRDEFTAVLSFT